MQIALSNLQFTSNRLYYDRLKKLLTTPDSWKEPISILTIRTKTIVVDGSHRCWINYSLGATDIEAVELDEDNWEERLPKQLQGLKHVAKKEKTKGQRKRVVERAFELVNTLHTVDSLYVAYSNWSNVGYVDETKYVAEIQQLLVAAEG